MGGLFSKSKPKQSRVTEQDKAVLQLKNQRDKLKQYQKKVNNNLDKEREVAKQLLRDGKKEKAKLLLRRKRFLEGLLEKTDAQLDNIDKLTHDLEFAQVEHEVVRGLAAGNDALKKMHQIMSIEDVEKIMDDTRESIEYQREIDDLLSGGLTAEDESEVLAELDAIVKESMPAVPASEEQELNLPDVPKDAIGVPAKERKEKERKKEADAPLMAS